MKKNLNKDSKSFTWKEWIRSANSIKVEMCCFGLKPDGTWEHWHLDKDGKKIKANHVIRTA